MLNVIQKLLSKTSFKYAPFGANELNGKQSGVLYSRKGMIDCPFDFYYIKHGFVYYVNYLFDNDVNHHRALRNLVSYGDTKKMPTPREYILIAEHLRLDPNYDSFRDVVLAWMNFKGLFFFEDIPETDLPNNVPSDFLCIADDVRLATNVWLNSGEVSDKDHIYADLYIINGKVCLITGTGKSDACKAISEKNLAYDNVAFRKGDCGLACRFKYTNDAPFLTVDYCIHMDENDSEETTDLEDIVEVDRYHYIQKAQWNITYHGVPLPSFYHALKNSNCKMVIVPYTNSLEKKTDILRDYLCN